MLPFVQLILGDFCDNVVNLGQLMRNIFSSIKTHAAIKPDS